MRIVETNKANQHIYSVYYESNGKKDIHSTICYSVEEVQINGKSYFFVYDSFMRPIEESFQFLNVFLADKAPNTRAQYMNALKILYSFESIIGKKLESFSASEVEMLKCFLQGFCYEGEVFVLENLTERSPETVNQYLGVYRKYLDYLNKENKYLTARKSCNIMNPYFSSYTVLYTSPYKVKAKSTIKEEVAKYITVNDFINIISLIRRSYTIREECIVRLMFEAGLRIGEVLGLTNEDIVTEKIDERYYNCVYIRNRVTDKRDQHAKGLLKPKNETEYGSKAYNTMNAGYQKVYISDSLYDLLGDYIDATHEKAQHQYYTKYTASSVADSVCGNDFNFYVFSNKYGGRLSNTSWNSTIRHIFETVGIQVDKNIRENNLNHRFRQGFAMFQVQYMHYNERDIADLLRHRSTATVHKYHRPTISDKIKLKETFIDELYKQIPELMEI